MTSNPWRGGVLSLLSVLGLLLLAAPSPAQLLARQIDAASVDRLQVGGSGARGGIGDWALQNGTLCAVVSDPAHESPLSPYGGVLVDLGHCGRADDQFHVLQPLINLRRGIGFPVTDLRAEVVDGEARLTTVGETGGVRFETRYVMDESEPTALRVRTVAERVEDGERMTAFGEIALHPNATLRAFALDTRHPERSVGFDHPAAEGESIGVMLNAMQTPDVQVLVSDEPGQDIAYGLQLISARRERPGREPRELPHFTINGEGFTMRGILSRPFWMGSPDTMGLFKMMQSQVMNLSEGDRLVVERVLWVGDRADVACVTDRIHQGAPRISGSVDDPDARIHVDRADGGAATLARPAADGAFAFRLPPGDYALRVVAVGRPDAEARFRVAEDDIDLGAVTVGPAARVALPRGKPMRLVFRGEGGLPDPRFGDDLLGLRFGEQPRGWWGDADVPSSLQSADVSLAGVASDPRSIAIAPGRYRVLATRGVEYEVTETRFEVGPGATHPLEIAAPARAVESPGWITADMHVHSAGSFDSAVPLAERVRTFAAQGAEVLVSTEHDNVVDMMPVVQTMGLTGLLVTVMGSEITSSAHTEAAPHTFGHANAFPLPSRPELYRGGALSSEGVRLRTPIAELRALGGERVFQLNHPRRAGGERQDGAFFSHLSVSDGAFDPTLPLESAANRSLIEADPKTGVRDVDFDAVELLNGSNGPDQAYYRSVRADWFSLMRQGEVRTGTANSDTHGRRSLVALPVSFVRMEDDRVGAFDEVAFHRAVRAGRLFGTTGPLLDVRLSGGAGDQAGIGQRFTGGEGTLSVSVRAASWVPVSTLRVYLDGEPLEEREIRAGDDVQVPLRFARDGFVTVEVEGEPGDVYAAVAPGYLPFAYSNPIFVDADADGRWTPPGLP